MDKGVETVKEQLLRNDPTKTIPAPEKFND
jgi:hypothetical protein